MDFVPQYDFRQIVKRHKGERRLRRFSCWGKASLSGVRTADVPREPERHRSLPALCGARVLYQDDRLMAELEGAVCALDATIIDLCRKLFPWAKAAHNEATTAGIKLHTQLHVQSNLPVFARVSEAAMHEVRILDEIVFEPGAIYVVDRGYTDFARLNKIH